MNLVQMLLDGSNDSSIDELGHSFGLDRNSTRSVVEQLSPMLTRSMKQQASEPGGLETLGRALSSGQHQRYLDQPTELRRRETVTDGNAILGHLFGGKEMSREVARRAADRTGVDDSIVKRMLPLVATMVMGAMSKQTSGGAALANLAGGGGRGGASNLLESLLDSDGDGSIADDLLGLASKFLR